MIFSEIIDWIDGGYAEQSITRLNFSLDRQDKRMGGYLCLFSPADVERGPSAVPAFIIRIGEPKIDQCPRYFELCVEKGRRLIANPTHISAWESRDPSKQCYGGAVRAGNWVISFSGMSEHADEAICLEIASLGRAPISNDDVANILEISGNTLFWH